MSEEIRKRKKTGRRRRTLIKYALLQVPGIGLLMIVLFTARRWLDLPGWFIWGLVALWVVKDMVLFPFVRRAYESSSSEPSTSMVGMRGVATEQLNPRGYIRVRGELWRAELLDSQQSVEAGRMVRIREERGLTLLVEPIKKDG
jgi:membrane protein implicated in regulation of membrane protease activity